MNRESNNRSTQRYPIKVGKAAYAVILAVARFKKVVFYSFTKNAMQSASQELLVYLDIQISTNSGKGDKSKIMRNEKEFLQQRCLPD